MGEFGEAADIATVAERLRMVRQARRKFLKMWAIDRSLVDPLVDRLAADLGDFPDSDPPPEASAEAPESAPASAPEPGGDPADRFPGPPHRGPERADKG